MAPRLIETLLGATFLLAVGAAVAQEELNIYSSRHYDSDEALYEGFTEKTGIEINRIEGDADELIERIRLEGENSPADVLITVDAGRLWRAEQAGILAPVDSAVLDERIPSALRHPDGLWYGFSTRARVIVVNDDLVDPALVQNYEDLARSELEGLVCVRSSSNIYNLSLMASMIDHLGEEAASEWARGVVDNFARDPEGNDTAQIEAVGAGECGVTLANTYYYVRLMKSDDPADRAIVESTTVVFPNQSGRGSHVNISGAGMVANPPHPDAAKAFFEYLASDQAQAYFAGGNNEYPVVEGVELDNPELEKLGSFKADDLNVGVLGENQPAAQVAFDEAGWK